MVEEQRDVAPEVTALLKQHASGKGDALERLLPLVYGELRQMARRFMAREKGEHTLQATALVNEAYFRLVDQKQHNYQNRKHFMGLMGQLMRRVLVDHARAKRADKRGGKDQVKVEFQDDVADKKAPDVLVLDRALSALAKLYPRAAKVVELRYFVGLSNEEVADVMETSLATVKRDWALAKAWLFREVSG